MTVRQALAEGVALLQSDSRACSGNGGFSQKCPGRTGWINSGSATGLEPVPDSTIVGEIINPSLDSSLLLACALGYDRYRVLASLPDEVAESCLAVYRALLARRISGESIAYILGYREFYGRSFRVDRRVLVPRSETELLVDVALSYLDHYDKTAQRPLMVHDCCTGSGCVGISIAAERPAVDVSVSDISADALEVATSNAVALLPATLPMYHSDLLTDVPGKYHVITANPPYVCSSISDTIISGGSVEPRLALDGGSDGLELYRRLAPQAFDRLRPGGSLLAEIGDEQGAAVQALFAEAGFHSISLVQDLAGRDRVVTGEKA